MFGLGKKRTKFGRWLDKQKDINQAELEKASSLSNATISRLCNQRDYAPKISTIHQINNGLKKLKKDVRIEDFLNM